MIRPCAATDEGAALEERKPRPVIGRHLLGLGLALVVAAPLQAADVPAAGGETASAALSYDKARRTAEASLRLHPGTDARYDYRALWAGSADLDGDGRVEVVYLYTATEAAAGSAQLNELVVMTPLRDGDPRGQAAIPGKSVYDDETYALIRSSGYADDSTVHIPGDVESIRMDGDRIAVSFTSEKGSRLCERGRGKPLCPPDGRQEWVYRWTPGTLTRQ